MLLGLASYLMYTHAYGSMLSVLDQLVYLLIRPLCLFKMLMLKLLARDLTSKKAPIYIYQLVVMHSVRLIVSAMLISHDIVFFSYNEIASVGTVFFSHTNSVRTIFFSQFSQISANGAYVIFYQASDNSKVLVTFTWPSRK